MGKEKIEKWKIKKKMWEKEKSKKWKIKNPDLSFYHFPNFSFFAISLLVKKKRQNAKMKENEKIEFCVI